MTAYKWTCQACEHVNEPGIANCEKCTCPAIASGNEVENYKYISQVGSPPEIIEFFTTSTLKLVVMSLCTFSLYVFYWFYKNWHSIKRQTQKSKINPVLRALFSPIFAYSCFSEIKNASINSGLNINLPISYLAIIYFVINLMSRLPDAYSFLGILTVLPLIPVNNTAIAINKTHNPSFQNNEDFSTKNKIALWVGGLIWILALIGSIAPKHA